MGPNVPPGTTVCCSGAPRPRVPLCLRAAPGQTEAVAGGLRTEGGCGQDRASGPGAPLRRVPSLGLTEGTVPAPRLLGGWPEHAGLAAQRSQLLTLQARGEHSPRFLHTPTSRRPRALPVNENKLNCRYFGLIL